MYPHHHPAWTFLTLMCVSLIQRCIRTFMGRYILRSFLGMLATVKGICYGERQQRVRNEFVFILTHQPLLVRAKSTHGFRKPIAVPLDTVCP